MTTITRNLIRAAILGLLILGLLAFSILQLNILHPGSAAGASPKGIEAVSNAQMAAIQGAQQLLLLQPGYQYIYLPRIVR